MSKKHDEEEYEEIKQVANKEQGEGKKQNLKFWRIYGAVCWVCAFPITSFPFLYFMWRIVVGTQINYYVDVVTNYHGGEEGIAYLGFFAITCAIWYIFWFINIIAACCKVPVDAVWWNPGYLPHS